MGTIVAVTCAVLLLVSCGPGVVPGGVTGEQAGPEQAGPVQTESRSIEPQGATSAVVDVAMGAGQLRIAGGAQNLLDATFVYNIPSWRPIVEYRLNGPQGNLAVRQPERTRGAVNTRYEWDLRLSNEIPMDLRVDQGAGTSNIDLRGLDLRTFDLDAGAGRAEIDLTGDWRRDVTAGITTGAGEITLRLPKTTGVRVEIARGIGVIDTGGLRQADGAYVNDAFGNSAVTMRIAMTAGVGAIHLELEQ